MFALAPTAQATDNWATDVELDGIIDLLDPDYLTQPIKVARLPLKYAVTTVHGRGERVVYAFSDPNCGYCRELETRLEAIGNVTVHTFMITFLGPDSKTLADAVWCARDRGAAWRAVMRRKKIATPAKGCHAPTDATMKLAGLLGITLTPTLFHADGTRMNGIKPQAEIVARLRPPGATPQAGADSGRELVPRPNTR